MLFNSFPREMAFPKRKGPDRIVYNSKQFNKVINTNNGRKNLYTSIYSFTKLLTDEYGKLKPDYNSAVIDKLFFDFDSNNSFKNCYKLHTYLVKHNIKHLILFSGGGFHIYIFCEETNLLFKKDAIKNAQKYLAKENELTIDESSIGDIDEKVIGDIAQIARIPHTYNIKRKRWCIPILNSDFIEGFEFIKHLAEGTERLGNHPVLYGRKKFNIKLFDFENKEEKTTEEEDIPLLGEQTGISEEKFWPCIDNMIVKRSGCHAWYWAIIWFRDKGFTKKETDEILKKYLSKYTRTDGDKNDYLHCIKSDRHLDTVFKDRTNKHWFPSAEKLFKHGYCLGKCEHYKKGNCLYFNGDTEDWK